MGGTLFALASWGFKPKTSATTGAEISAAAAAKAAKEKADLEAMEKDKAERLVPRVQREPRLRARSAPVARWPPGLCMRRDP